MRHVLILASLLAVGSATRSGAQGDPAIPPAKAPVPAEEALKREAFGPETFVAKEDSVPVRSEPGFVYREVRYLRRGEEVLVDARQGQWLHLRPEGWVLADHVVPVAEREAALRPMRPLVVTRQGARVREQPTTSAPIVEELELGQPLEGRGPTDGWWELATGGFVSATVVQEDTDRAAGAPPSAAAAPLPSGAPQGWAVSAATANVRAGRGTDHAVVRALRRGDVVPVTEVVDGWAHVPDGWVRADLLQAPAADAPAVQRAQRPMPPVPSGDGRRGPLRWSLVDLNGVLFEITELHPRSVVAPIRQEIRDAGFLEEDWTYLGLSIGVPEDSSYRFNYDPNRNATVVVDASGQKYPNVYARGPVDRMPANLRRFFQPRTVAPGERYDGLLLFRPTLRVDQIQEVGMMIGGRMQKLYPAQ